VLSAAVVGVLLTVQRRTTAPAGVVRRSRAILLLADGHECTSVAEKVGLSPRHVYKWGQRFLQQGVDGLEDKPRPGARPKFSPGVALHLVKMACEMPDLRGRSLSQWDCSELARQLQAEGVVDSISAQSVRRILNSHRLKPWRHHPWLSPKTPRDAALAAAVRNLSDLYSRPLETHEAVLCVDEKTMQPRTRKAKTLPPEPGKPIRVEDEYEHKGILHLFAAFDTRTVKVYHITGERKRQIGLLQLMEILDREFDPSFTAVHIVLDNVRMHKGKLVKAWLAKHHASKSSAGALLLDESGRAVVQYPSAQAVRHHQLRGQTRLGRASGRVCEGVEQPRPRFPLVPQILRQGAGRV
jgi:transposase